MNNNVIFFVVSFAGGICVMIAFVKHVGMLGILRTYHQDVYQELGQPVHILVWPLRPGASFSFFASILLGDFDKNLVPEQVLRESSSARFWYLVGFGLTLASFFLLDAM